MTTQPSLAGEACSTCHHLQDEHLLALIPTSHPMPMGLMFCPQPDCDCGSTWRAGTRPSTPEEIAETRMLVREALARAGSKIPAFLL